MRAALTKPVAETNMSRRVLSLTVLLCLATQLVFAKAEAITPEQVIAKYLEAVGADRLPSITTFVERGEIQGKITNPNFANLGRVLASHGLSERQQPGRYEFYFKTPNLRYSSSITETNAIRGLHGCDGKVAWNIDASLKHIELPPKPGQPSDCDQGFDPFPRQLRASNSKMRLEGKKKIDGREVWAIKVEIPKSGFSEVFYFDAESFLLIRSGWRDSTITYSDYRDVGGMKQPFAIVREDSVGRIVTTVREIQVNVSIDEARFTQPKIQNGSVSLEPAPHSPQEAQVPGPALSKVSAPSTAVASVTEVNFPNFMTCTIADLQSLVPELNGLKPVSGQGTLQVTLERIGNKLIAIGRSTPNLISHEVVSETQKGVADKRRDYDYLILTRVEGTEIALNEYRVDLATGDKFRSDEVNNSSTASSGANAADTGGPNHQPTSSQTGTPPLSQGFATSWVYFYPRNQVQSLFRYLGEQKIDGRHAVVVAFAQKPEAVRVPALFRYKGKSVPMFFQGIAWFDTSDFRILRLHTDLLSPLPDVALESLSADIQFVPTRVADVPTILVLPRDVSVTSVVGGTTFREHHTYADYRLFRARSKILLNP
jgi:hypothetical protein